MNLMSFKAAASGLLLAAGMAFSGTASALAINTTALKANSTLQFSNEAFAAASAARITFSALGNTIAGPTTPYEDLNVPSFILPVTKADVSIGWNLKVTPNSGEAIGSALLVNRGTRQLALANFEIDYKTDQVYADVIVNGKTTNMAVYSFQEMTDLKIGLKGLSLTMNQTLGNLVLTTKAADTFADALSLSGPLKETLAGLNFGTITIDISTALRKPVSAKPFTASMLVPETSTYAMMALGLAGIACVARRKQQA